jgi:DNA-binding MarR family transcriptional regulator
MIQQTSIFSYHTLDLTPRQLAVLNALEALTHASNRHLAKYLETDISSVTGRTNELVAKGLVQESHKDRDPMTGKTVIIWCKS